MFCDCGHHRDNHSIMNGECMVTGCSCQVIQINEPAS